MRAIIMSDGRAIRWYNEKQNELWGNDTKQMVLVDGEPILHRTVRLCAENGIEDIWITSHKSEHDVPGATRYEPEINFDKFYAAKKIWDLEGTVFLYGDCFYTEEAMKTIIETDHDNIIFFGRFGESALLGHYGEIFGVKVIGAEAFDRFKEAVLNIFVWKELEKGRNGAWEIYRYLNGIRGPQVNEHNFYENHYVEIDDFTDDFDTPEYYEYWLSVYEEHKNK